MKTCETCAYSAPRKPLQTYKEAWDEDTRPFRPKGFLGALKWLWNPHHYKDLSPYYDDDKRYWFFGKEHADTVEKNNRQNIIICTFMPEHEKVHKKHYCGQHKLIQVKEHYWVMGKDKEIPERE